MSAFSNRYSTLARVQVIIQHTVTDETLLWEALQAGGICQGLHGDMLPTDGNKRLAVLGDAVLELALMDDWYNSGSSRERATHIDGEVASNINLDRIGKNLGLDQYVNRTGTGNSGAVSGRTMAATMEAILGAVYYDGGLVAVKKVMRNMGLVPASPI